MPNFLQIEPVGQCNLKCQMCPIQFRTDGKDGKPLAFMKFDDFVKLIGEFPEIQELHLQGLGEPMMHPQLFEMVAFAAKRGIKVSTNSNMTLFSQRRAEHCVTSGLDSLHVSVDGATAETFENIRVGGKFERVISNVEILKKAKEKLKSETPHLRLIYVLMRQNLHELPDFVRLAEKLNVHEIFAQHLCHDFQESTLPEHYSPMRDFVNEQTLLHEAVERVQHFFDEARALAQEHKVSLRLPAVRPSERTTTARGRKRCSWPWDGMYFSYDGQSMPCCMISTPDRFSFGSAVKQGARQLWEGERYESFRQSLDSEEPPEICRSCAIYQGRF
ncbi:radical SAM protein [Pontibacter ummariensis]|nr:radical SAM/SPASM domain-containing protein [Pontibacter ummariensis]